MRAYSILFFFNDTATTEIYTLSLHDALPICRAADRRIGSLARAARDADGSPGAARPARARSEEHTSELQSPCNLVCRLLLEKKKAHMLHSDFYVTPPALPHVGSIILGILLLA